MFALDHCERPWPRVRPSCRSGRSRRAPLRRVAASERAGERELASRKQQIINKQSEESSSIWRRDPATNFDGSFALAHSSPADVAHFLLFSCWGTVHSNLCLARSFAGDLPTNEQVTGSASFGRASTGRRHRQSDSPASLISRGWIKPNTIGRWR